MGKEEKLEAAPNTSLPFSNKLWKEDMAMIFDQMCALVLKGSTGKTFLLVSLPPCPKPS